MITKDEWKEWKNNKITKELVELLNVGRTTAVDDLLLMRGDVGDFPRGAEQAYREVIELINTGEGIYSQEE